MRLLQLSDYCRNIEKLIFWASDDRKMRTAKQELLSQIDNLQISISGKGFFAIDRSLLTGVSVHHDLSFTFSDLILLTLIFCSDGSGLRHLCDHFTSTLPRKPISGTLS